MRATRAFSELVTHSAMSSSVVRPARSRTWISFMPSHQYWAPISFTTGLPARTWRTNSRGEICPAAAPTTWAAMARTSQSSQLVGAAQSSPSRLRSCSANLRFSTAVIAIASSWVIRSIVVTSIAALVIIV